MRRNLWLTAGFICLFATMAGPLSAQIEADPRIISRPDEGPMDFTFTLPNFWNGPVVWVGWLQIEEPIYVPLSQGAPPTVLTYQYAHEPANYRLRPHGVVWALDQGSAYIDVIYNTAVQMTTQVQFLRAQHDSTRDSIEEDIDALVIAIRNANWGSISALRAQLQQLELDDTDTLTEIDQAEEDAGNSLSFILALAVWGNDGAIIRQDVRSFRTSPNPNFVYEAIGEAFEEDSPGSVFWVNRDDDNGNGVFDDGDASVQNENDLMPFCWFYGRPVRNLMGSVWGAASLVLPANVAVWSSRQKGDPPPLPGPAFTGPLFLEGKAVSGLAGGSRARATMSGFEDSAVLTVVGVESVTLSPGQGNGFNWEEAVGHSFAKFDLQTLTNVPPISGGEYRLFPCQNDSFGLPHDTIEVSIQIVPAMAGVTVWLRSVDVDDPGWSAPPVDDETGQFSTYDNRYTTDGPLWGTLIIPGEAVDGWGRIKGVTNQNGLVFADFNVSGAMQPGNNFRILAGYPAYDLIGPVEAKRPVDDAKIYFTGTEIRVPENNPGTAAPVKQSPLVTIWRKIHIELDRLTGLNDYDHHFAAGTIVGISEQDNRLVYPNGFDVMSGYFQGIETDLDEGRFQNGLLVTPQTARVVADNGEDWIYLAQDGSALLNSDFALFDDDEIETFPSLDMTYLQNSDNPMQNYLALAYIRPVVDAANPNPILPFYTEPLVGWMNTPDLSPADFLAQHASDSAADHSVTYWTSYMLTGFQSGRGMDGDPDPEIAAMELEPERLQRQLGYTLVGPQAFGVYQSPAPSVIHLETIREYCEVYMDDPVLVQREVVVTQMGRQFGLYATQGGIMGNNDCEIIRVNGVAPQFSEISLDKIRSVDKPKLE